MTLNWTQIRDDVQDLLAAADGQSLVRRCLHCGGGLRAKLTPAEIIGNKRVRCPRGHCRHEAGWRDLRR